MERSGSSLKAINDVMSLLATSYKLGKSRRRNGLGCLRAQGTVPSRSIRLSRVSRGFDVKKFAFCPVAA